MKCFSLIYQGDVHFASEKKVIPSEDFSLILSAKELVEKAKEDAVSYVAKAEQECEEIKKNAEEEGFSEGLSKFNDHILQFEIELRKIRHEAQKSILPTALKAAKKKLPLKTYIYKSLWKFSKEA